MYTLIVSDLPDPKSVLPIIEALQMERQEPKAIILLPTEDMTWAGTSRSGAKLLELDIPECTTLKPGLDQYQLPLTPCELVDFGILRQEELLRGALSRVTTGLSTSPALGLEALSRGVSAAAIHAALTYGLPAWAFAQTGEQVRGLSAYIRDTLMRDIPDPGSALTINFPPKDTGGWARPYPAHYQPHHRPPVNQVPRARDDNSDVDQFSKGKTTVTSFSPRISPLLRF